MALSVNIIMLQACYHTSYPVNNHFHPNHKSYSHSKALLYTINDSVYSYSGSIVSIWVQYMTIYHVAIAIAAIAVCKFSNVD